MSNKPIKAYILTKKPMFWPKWILKPENSIVGHYYGTVISIVQSMYDQKSPNLDQIATELFFMTKYLENIQGSQEKNLQKY